MVLSQRWWISLSDIVFGIRGFLRSSWDFLMHTYIPGTDIAFGVFFVGLTVIGIGFRFLSLAVGHNIGEVGGFSAISSYGARGSKNAKVSAARKNDVR